VIGSARTWEELRLVLEAAPVLERVRSAGFLTVCVSNQPDVARGHLSLELLEQFHLRLRQAFPLDALEVCTSDRDEDPRRKPNPGMLLEAAGRLGISLARSFMLGDTERDLVAGRRAGVRTILLATDYNRAARSLADHVVARLDEVPALLLEAP
jgi:D-glycero-D-manno-heptose 1,7-bisphosphate phosphatase